MATTVSSPSDGSSGKGAKAFFGVLAALFLLRLGLPHMELSSSIALPANIVLTLVFVGLPIVALFRFAQEPWTAKRGALFLLAGVVIQGLGILIRSSVGPESGVSTLGDAIAQFGLPIWCVGLGALLATTLKEPNLIPPVAIFLAGFDMLAIFWPESPTQRILAAHPQVFQNIAASVPSITGGPLAYVGPADFFFLAMFFIALHRFHLRIRTTFHWVMVTLLLYIGVVICFGGVSIGPVTLGMLPALVPIGLVTLIVNWPEFRLTSEERWMTVGVACISIAMVIFALTRPKPPTAPLPAGAVPEVRGPVGTPVPTDPD